MPLYDFRCLVCELDFELVQSIHETTRNEPCPECNGAAVKVMAFPALKRAMPEHFNSSLGKHVNNEREYKDGLKEASDTASARAGREMSFSPVDLRDTTHLGVTDEGLDATRRREVKEGKRDVVKHF